MILNYWKHRAPSRPPHLHPPHCKRKQRKYFLRLNDKLLSSSCTGYSHKRGGRAVA